MVYEREERDNYHQDHLSFSGGAATASAAICTYISIRDAASPSLFAESILIILLVVVGLDLYFK